MDIVGYTYAGVVALGGTIGYFKAGSVPSLVMGLTSGALLAYGANRVSQNPKDVYLSLALSLFLLIVMGSRYYNSGKFMPAGLVATLSFIMALLYGIRLIS